MTLTLQQQTADTVPTLIALRHDSALTIDSARMILRSEGIRLTPQRLMIVDVLIGRQDHPTVEQIYDIVRIEYPAISLATVYNTVSMLARHRLIAILHGGKHGLRLDPFTEMHAHGHCTECGAIFNIGLNGPIDLEPAIVNGFVEEQVEVTVYGRCRACASTVA